ncbi:transglutaminase-like cysteine peptidase [Sulfurovum sp.]|uniref:transglutaminase-like cysteine peptidase n=1 Tax=Sulfurovum sp. TaxID=1969726 RepID=UPI0028683034|nr:transglutaminase-like cysteine peptidase [Sulfurovum sp.]
MLSTVTNCTRGAQSPLLSDERTKEIEKKYGPLAVARIEAGLRLINKIDPLSDKEKLDKVNGFVNQVRFTSDQIAWGKKDYWARPVEFLGRDKGDCEDFVITKYFMLRKSGVPEEKLFFTYVKALRLNEAHMVLSYYETPKSIPLILDNLNFKVLPASKRSDLAFVYSFNAKELYLNRQQGLGKIVPGGRDKNKKWASFLDKVEKEFR